MIIHKYWDNNYSPSRVSSGWAARRSDRIGITDTHGESVETMLSGGQFNK